MYNIVVAVTTDVPPVAVWSMAAIGWGLRGGRKSPWYGES